MVCPEKIDSSLLNKFLGLLGVKQQTGIDYLFEFEMCLKQYLPVWHGFSPKELPLDMQECHTAGEALIEFKNRTDKLLANKCIESGNISKRMQYEIDLFKV